MAILRMKLVSPLSVYLDESMKNNALASRPQSLEGKLVGLLPNWRPAATEILTELGKLLEERYRPKQVIMEPKVSKHQIPSSERLDELALQYDVIIAASGD